MCPMPRRWIPLTLVCATALGRVATGQSGSLTSASYEREYEPGGSDFALVIRGTRLPARGLGEDIGLRLDRASFAGLAYRTLIAGVEAGADQPVRLGPCLALFRGGMSSIVALGALGARFVPGMQGGVALLLPLDRTTAVRVDVGRQHFFGDDAPSNRWTIGFGLSALPPAGGAAPR